MTYPVGSIVPRGRELSLLASSQEVVLRVPALAEFLRVVRVTASGLATRLGFSLDDVDDLRLALDELCYVLIGKGNELETLELRYQLDDRSLTIVGETGRHHGGEPLVLGDLSKQILTALVDEHHLWDSDGSSHFSVTKRQATPAR